MTFSKLPFTKMMLDELRLGDVSPEESSLGDKMSYEQLLGKNDDR